MPILAISANFRKKNGPMVIEPLLVPNFIPKIRKILGAVYEVSRTGWPDERTDGRTNETDIIDPSIYNWGPIIIIIIMIMTMTMIMIIIILILLIIIIIISKHIWSPVPTV